MPQNQIPSALLQIQKLVFDPIGLNYQKLFIEKESAEYGACQFQLKELKVIFREAKITPTKTGQFVTLWKRIEKGPIQPFDLSDDIGLVVVFSKKDKHFGQFVFPKSLLVQQGVFTTELKEGKRAIRVYPPWDEATNKTAQKTQQWQLDYFLEIPLDKPIDLKRAKLLYFLNT